MKVTITIEVDDDDREAINGFFGKQGKATRDEIRQWAHSVVTGAFMDLGPLPEE